MLPDIIAQECRGFFPQERRWQHIDWLSLSMPSSGIPSLHEYLNRLINKLGLGWIRGKGAAFFAESLSLPHKGIRILFSDGNSPTNRGCASVQFSGKFFSFVSEKKIQSLLFWFVNQKFSVKCTRIDIANNIFSREDLLQGLIDGLRSGAYCTAGTTDWQEIYGRRRQQTLGQTLYLGSRKSETFTRIYDAAPVHGEGITLPHGWRWIRHEVESKGSMAQRIFNEFLSHLPKYPNESPMFWHVFGSVLHAYLCRHEIQILESGDRASRRQACSEWKKLLPMSWNFRYKLCRSETPLEKTLDWMISGGPCRFALAIVEEFGSEGWAKLLTAWKHRMIAKGKDFELELKKITSRFDGGTLVIRPPDCQVFDF